MHERIERRKNLSRIVVGLGHRRQSGSKERKFPPCRHIATLGVAAKRRYRCYHARGDGKKSLRRHHLRDASVREKPTPDGRHDHHLEGIVHSVLQDDALRLLRPVATLRYRRTVPKRVDAPERERTPLGRRNLPYPFLRRLAAQKRNEHPAGFRRTPR